jgi:hypothetical protein
MHLGEFAPGTWVQRSVWETEHRVCVVRSRDELVAVLRTVDENVAETAQESTGECFPLALEAFGCSLSWSDELCVADVIASDWKGAPWPVWTEQELQTICERAKDFDELFTATEAPKRAHTKPYEDKGR